ncbi:hypothetical protein F6X39_36155, partial [Paraburkholderia sp. UCT2]|nr:hypothetical protein [Paraburkholderia sp. UCT2]
LKSWRFELSSLPTFFAAAKKVGAAPHRGNANRPIRQQGKANQARTTKKPQPISRRTKKTKKSAAPAGAYNVPRTAPKQKNARPPLESKPRTTRRRNAPE